MNSKEIFDICESRMLVGYLGEKHQASWWECSFLSSQSNAFLAPVYPNSTLMAQYSGICHAASLIHDEHIGVGKHYHLYRLPDSIERALFKCLQEKELAELIKKSTSTADVALDRLRALGAQSVGPSEGPIAVGDFSDTNLDELLRMSLSYYTVAFESGNKTFPYMRRL